MIIDTHAHVFSEKLMEIKSEVIDRAIQNGVNKIIMPNIDEDSIESMIQMETDYSQCIATMGLHPCSVNGSYKKVLLRMRKYFDQRKFIAVGETGIDLYWDDTYIKEQKDSFAMQCDWALEFDIPVIIHCRDSYRELIDVLTGYKGKGLKGVWHCFTGTKEQGEKVMDIGLFIGLGGVLTFKNSGLDKEVESFSRDRILLETDSPYLAPHPNRGKTNEPSYILHVLNKLADIWGIDNNEVAKITTENAVKLFGPSLIN